MDTLAWDLARGCRVWVDVSGLTYDPARPTNGTPRRQDRPWQHEVLGYLASGAATLVHRDATGLDAASRGRVEGWSVLADAGGVPAPRSAGSRSRAARLTGRGSAVSRPARPGG
jgi:hypothetical protein